MKRFLIVFLFVFIIGNISALDFEYSVVNIGMELPDSWLTTEYEDVMIAGSPDEEFIVLIYSAGDEAMMMWGLEAIELAVLEVYFTEFEVLEENELTLDELSAYEVIGSGYFNEEEVTASIILIMADPGYAYIVFIGTESGWENWEEEIEEIYESIYSLSEM